MTVDMEKYGYTFVKKIDNLQIWKWDLKNFKKCLQWEITSSGKNYELVKDLSMSQRIIKIKKWSEFQGPILPSSSTLAQRKRIA